MSGLVAWLAISLVTKFSNTMMLEKLPSLLRDESAWVILKADEIFEYQDRNSMHWNKLGHSANEGVHSFEEVLALGL